MKKIKLPSIITLACGGIGSFWIANIINPGFNPIGVMVLLLAPIFILDFLYPDLEIDKLYRPAIETEMAHSEKPIPTDE